nr:DUF6382 domain-containing protein [Lachnospiraceae bacterium]
MDLLPKISYKRSPENSYMIIEGESFDCGYEERMLRENTVKSLLTFYAVQFDDQLQIWYTITGKRSLRDLVEQEGLSVENISIIINSLAAAWLGIQKYLISKDNLYLSVDTVYFEKEKDNYGAYLCYCPFIHPETNEQIRSILEFFISIVDHEKQEITKLCYEMYNLSMDDINFDELIKLCNKYHKKEDTGFNNDQVLNDVSDLPPVLNDPDSKISENRMLFWEDVQPSTKIRTEDKSIISKIKNRFLEFHEKHFAPKPSRYSRNGSFNDEISIFDPEDSLREATVILSDDDREFSGKLIYEGNGDEKDY